MPIRPDRPLVVVESPFAADSLAVARRNERYVNAAMRDCLLRGEAPFASHALYTLQGVLDDGDKAERRLGIEAGLAWGAVSERAVVYDDLGVSDGMVQGVQRALDEGRPVERRRLPGWEKEATPAEAASRSRLDDILAVAPALR